ncbi:MAG: SLBB domain-containing protein [Armatimonadota bacterium]
MTRALALIPAILAMAFISPGDRAPIRLKRGDSVAVTSEYGGDFRIMPDGAIYGRGFGRVILEGQTWSEAEATLKKALRKFVKEDEVHLVLKDLRREVVYMVGMGGGQGTLELAPDMRLRQLLSSAKLDENLDQVQVQVFRDGKKMTESIVANLLKGDKPDTDIPLLSDDVVTLTPVPFIRIWISGLVNKSGQIKLPGGTDPYKAIAEAGGIRASEVEADKSLQDEVHIIVRRGPDNFEFPIRQDISKPTFQLEPGDMVTVLAPEVRRITVGGEVNRPGELIMRGDHTLLAAISQVAGASPNGTLNNVLVLRKGDLFKVDASVTNNGKGLNLFSLESGDLVYVQRNERTFLILGDVAKPGKVLMKDGKTYRLADALAESDGLAGRGTLRRVSVARPDASGKFKVEQYNLDEFLKDGNGASNPEIQPGDCILFGEPKGMTFGNAMQALSGAILFQSISRGR